MLGGSNHIHNGQFTLLNHYHSSADSAEPTLFASLTRPLFFQGSGTRDYLPPSLPSLSFLPLSFPSFLPLSFPSFLPLSFPSFLFPAFLSSQGFVLVYCVTSKLSFQNIQKWLKDIEMVTQHIFTSHTHHHLMFSHCTITCRSHSTQFSLIFPPSPQNASPDVAQVLIGNKCDLESEKVIPTEEGQQLAASLGIPFFETSAKTNHNITEVKKQERKLRGRRKKGEGRDK